MQSDPVTPGEPRRQTTHLRLRLTCACETALTIAAAAASLATAKGRYYVWGWWRGDINTSNAEEAPQVDVMKGEMCVGMLTLIFSPLLFLPDATSSP